MNMRKIVPFEDVMQHTPWAPSRAPVTPGPRRGASPRGAPNTSQDVYREGRRVEWVGRDRGAWRAAQPGGLWGLEGLQRALVVPRAWPRDRLYIAQERAQDMQ